MHVIQVNCALNPSVKIVRVEEGNFDLEHGLRMFVELHDLDHTVLGRKLFRLEGEDFMRWVNGPEGHMNLVDRILTFVGCSVRV
jgi:hypothetical protein